jgi:hypothetical protein
MEQYACHVGMATTRGDKSLFGNDCDDEATAVTDESLAGKATVISERTLYGHQNLVPAVGSCSISLKSGTGTLSSHKPRSPPLVYFRHHYFLLL